MFGGGLFSNPIEEMDLLNSNTKKRKRVRNKSPVRQAVRKLLRGGMDYLAKKKKRGGSLKPAGGALKRAGEGQGGSLGAVIAPIATAIAADVGAHLIDKLGQAVKGAISDLMGQHPRPATTQQAVSQQPTITEEQRQALMRAIGGGGTERHLNGVDKKLCDMLSASNTPTVGEFLRTAASEYALALGDDRLETVLHGGCMALMQVAGNGVREDLVVDELSLAILGAWPKNKKKIENAVAEKIAETVTVVPKKKRILTEKQREALARGREARRLKKEAMKSAL
jgi:hypothetical protein